MAVNFIVFSRYLLLLTSRRMFIPTNLKHLRESYGKVEPYTMMLEIQELSSRLEDLLR